MPPHTAPHRSGNTFEETWVPGRRRGTAIVGHDRVAGNPPASRIAWFDRRSLAPSPHRKARVNTQYGPCAVVWFLVAIDNLQADAGPGAHTGSFWCKPSTLRCGICGGLAAKAFRPSIRFKGTTHNETTADPGPERRAARVRVHRRRRRSNRL